MNRSLKYGIVLFCMLASLSVGVVFGEKSTAAQSNAVSLTKAGSVADLPDPADAGSALINNVTYSKTSQSLEIKNNETSALDLTGWRLVVQNKTVYTFPKYMLGLNSAIKVHSGFGKNSKTDLYTAAAILTKADDEVTLLDTKGTVIDTSEESPAGVADSSNDA